MSLHISTNYDQIDSSNNNRILTTEHDLREMIYYLKERIKELESENKNNLLRISELTKTKNNFIELERVNQSLTEELKSKEDLVEEQKSLLLKEKQDNNKEKRLLENMFESKLNYYKKLKDTNDYKENAASHIIKLNEVQYYSIIQLENKIDEIKNFYENKLKEKELNFDKKYMKLKKDMMEFLKNAQKNMIKSCKNNLELNTKLGVLYKNEMLNELYNQSRLIEELIKEKEQQSKEIYLLKQELIVHRKVEKIIKNKNSKFLNLINNINFKINQKKDAFNNDQKEKDNTEIKIKNVNNKKLITKDLEKRAESVKNIKINFLKEKTGIQNNYLNEKINSCLNSHKKINIKEKYKIPSKIKKSNNKKLHQSERKDFIELEENDKNIINQSYNTEGKPEIYNILNDIINLCSKSLQIIIKENKFSQSFNDYSLKDFDIKSDYVELNDELKYELLIGILTKILNFLKINNNIKVEKENIFKINRTKSDLLKLNDEYNIKFLKLLSNENYNKIKILKLKNQKLKYDKLINIVGINKSKLSDSQQDFFKIKKNNLTKNKGGKYLDKSFNKNTTFNLFKRYINISNNINRKDIKN